MGEAADATFNKEDFLIFTAGVNTASKGDKLGKQYQTPASAAERGANFIIAGRGICKAPNPVEAAKNSDRRLGAYLRRVYV